MIPPCASSTRSAPSLAALAALVVPAPAAAQTTPAARRPRAPAASAATTAPAPSASPPPSVSPAAPSVLQALAAPAGDSPPPPPEGYAVRPGRRAIFPEEMAPPGDPAHPNAVRFALHGYFRAPLRLAWRSRTSPKPGEASTNIHTPWLIDDDPQRSGFVYTRNPEGDFTELYLMAGNTWLTGVVGLSGSLYSDPAQPIIDKQTGISQGYLMFRHKPDLGGSVKARIRIKGGAFQDRFGYMDKYDTYLFGRTHQMGEQVRGELDVGKLTLSFLDGFGAHLEDLQANQGLSLLHYFRASVSYDRTAEVSFYYLRTWTQDQRQLSQIADGSMLVGGVEGRFDTGAFGRLQAGISKLNADQAVWLSPSLELMNSFGGTGITQNYLGSDTSKNGTGALTNVGWQYDFSLAAFLKKVADVRPSGQMDATFSLFGMLHQGRQRAAERRSHRQPRRRPGCSSGAPSSPSGRVSWLGASSCRYDRIIPDIHDDPSAFRIYSPRLTLRTHWIADALLFLQVSRYDYGARVQLRQGQVPLETKPDTDMFKVQAQIAF